MSTNDDPATPHIADTPDDVKPEDTTSGDVTPARTPSTELALIEKPAVAEEPLEDEDDRQAVVSEALGGRVSVKGVWCAAAALAVFALGVGLLGDASGRSVAGADLSSLTTQSTTEIAPQDSSAVAAIAAATVFKIQAGSQAGSSFLIKDDLVVTNSHVVGADPGEKVQVTRTDGTSFEGTIVMRDRALDVALVEIPKQKIKPLSFVSTKEQTIGQPLTIAGYPIGLDFSVSTGVASAVDQVTNLRESYAQASLLQLSAPVNPGDSGGPVLDSRGRVMGMTTFRPDTSGTRSVQGVAFAVPSNDLAIAINQFEKHGDVKYGYLGVNLDSARTGGPKVTAITGDSPAASVDIAVDDHIVGVGDFATDSYTLVSRHLHTYRPGESVKLTLLRDGKERAVTVTLGSYGH